MVDLAVLAALGGVVVWVVGTGQYRGRALSRGPVRDVGWDVMDLAAAFGAFAVGPILARIIMVTLTAGITQLGWEMSPTTTAGVNAVTQAMRWLPAVAYLFVRLGRSGHLRLGGVIPRRPIRDLGVAVVGVGVAFTLASGLGLLIQMVWAVLDQPWPEHGHDVLEILTQNKSTLLAAVLFISAVVIAPIGEEFFFRGLLQTALQSVVGHERRWLSILPCAVFFGAVHYDSVPDVMLPVLVVLGVVFGWVYERTGSLWCAIGVHAGFNAANFMLTLWLS